MRTSLLSFTLVTAALMVGTPVAAEQASQQISPSGQSGARVQVTVSARIVSGESVRFGKAMQADIATVGTSRLNAPIARTSGQITLAGQQPIMLTEFH